MLIYTTNILALPVIAGAYVLEIYLLLAALRLFSDAVSGEWAERICRGLRPITDPIPEAVARWLAAMWKRPVPRWFAWATVMIGVYLLQHVLIWFAVSVLGNGRMN